LETALEQHDPGRDRHLIVRTAGDLDDDQRVLFVHCVEGGFHLGPDEDAIDGNVEWLAKQGVAYITIAHLFYRGVAANAPAIPLLSDKTYNKAFPQEPGIGLTKLGEALVRAMYRHGVLVDVSHMRQDAIDETFALIEELDAEAGADPREYPVIASHIGVRDVVDQAQSYNISTDTIRRIDARGGVVGLILAQHQLGETEDEEQSREVLRKHIEAIAAATGGHDCAALGSDLDGYINPTLEGIDQPDDFPKLEGWIRDICRDDAAAEAILHANARRVLAQALGSRTTAE
jgi:microsomal dipeptidase-like Zn-dependent dipeptidase